ncbi:MAG: hypothetical protein JWN44_2604 [Myxococcales bacterium]|nr:hypothetical protein [Myxococcales bacterium]
MRSLPGHRATRGIAALLAVVAVAGQISSFAHLVLVRHVTCAEHGDLVEVGHERTLVAASSRRQAPTAIATATLDEIHRHEHCLIAPMRRDRLAAGTAASRDSAHIDAYGTIGVVVDGGVVPPIAIIILAPKNSPPLA